MKSNHSSIVVAVIAIAVYFTIGFILLRKIYLSFLGRERAPIYWIIGRLLGGSLGGHLGDACDQARPEPDGVGPNWGGVVFWTFLLVGWGLILYAWLHVS